MCETNKEDIIEAQKQSEQAMEKIISKLNEKGYDI